MRTPRLARWTSAPCSGSARSRTASLEFWRLCRHRDCLTHLAPRTGIGPVNIAVIGRRVNTMTLNPKRPLAPRMGIEPISHSLTSCRPRQRTYEAVDGRRRVYPSVNAWQLGHMNRRFSERLSVQSPLM